MNDCGCTPPADPVVPTPEICNPVTYDDPVVTPEPCCLGCVYDDMVANWTKPVGEDTAIFPVCDPTRFRQDQCVTVLGTNGKGGTYKVEAILTDAIEVSIHDGDTYDVGGTGTVQGGRIYLLPVCPLTQAELIDLISGAIPSEFVLAVHASSDSTHGFALSVVDNKIKLTYSQANFESTVADALANLGVTWFVPVANSVRSVLFATEAAASGTLDVASAFSVSIPPNATHARLLVEFFLMAGHDIPNAVAGDCSVMEGYLSFAGVSQFSLARGSESVFPAVPSTEPGNRRDLASWGQVAMDIPMVAGQIDWLYTRTVFPPVGRVSAGHDAEGAVRLHGFLIAP